LDFRRNGNLEEIVSEKSTDYLKPILGKAEPMTSSLEKPKHKNFSFIINILLGHIINKNEIIADKTYLKNPIFLQEIKTRKHV
jgi:hypothetical protein